MTTIQQKRIEATLNKLINYQEGLMSRKQWLKLKFNEGCKAIEVTVPKYKYNRLKYNRMSGYDQNIYEAKMKETKISYELKELDNCFYDITKIEYNYFKAL